MKDSVRILGTRGSLPVSGADYLRYGGATTSFLLVLDDQAVLLDAGTGLCALPEEVLSLPSLDLLLTHPHIDHVLGLPVCPYLLRPNACLTVYAQSRGGLSAEEQIRRLFSPPLWPVGPDRVPAAVRFREFPASLTLGRLRAETIPGCHPGGVSVIRVSGSEHSVVLLTDCTITEELLPALRDFAQGCDLLLCDGQYSEDEWPSHRDYGHNTWLAAARFGRHCGARRMRIIHHDPSHSDAVLDAAEQTVRAVFPACSFARDGELIVL